MKPTQKYVDAHKVELFRQSIRDKDPFWNWPDYLKDPIEVSPSGAIKDGHHRITAILLEGIDPASLPSHVIQPATDEEILYPTRSWGVVRVDP